MGPDAGAARRLRGRCAPDKADVTISSAASDWMDIVTGKAEAAALYMTGKLSVDGDLTIAQRFTGLFGAQ